MTGISIMDALDALETISRQNARVLGEYKALCCMLCHVADIAGAALQRELGVAVGESTLECGAYHRLDIPIGAAFAGQPVPLAIDLELDDGWEFENHAGA